MWDAVGGTGKRVPGDPSSRSKSESFAAGFVGLEQIGWPGGHRQNAAGRVPLRGGQADRFHPRVQAAGFVIEVTKNRSFMGRSGLLSGLSPRQTIFDLKSVNALICSFGA